MPAVISDTTALNYLGRIGQFELLRRQFQHVLIPPAVLAELKARPDLPGLKSAQQALADGWLELRSPQNWNVVEALRATLGAGESQAIALAQELPASLLLMDEAAGREVAERLHLNLIGTTGILLRARKDGVIPRLKPVLDELLQLHGFRLSRKIYNDALREAGEAE
jgi:predicted nucleic acid-binding protein